MICKGLAYGASLSSFRGGPTFPAMFLGAAGGVALSHLPGLPLVYGVAMGIGAMTVVMLRLPLTSVLLATLLLSSDGLKVMPLAIVAVAVAYVASARLTPSPAPASTPQKPASERPSASRGGRGRVHPGHVFRRRRTGRCLTWRPCGVPYLTSRPESVRRRTARSARGGCRGRRPATR
jgi:chloride channel protein, CIC family